MTITSNSQTISFVFQTADLDGLNISALQAQHIRSIFDLSAEPSASLANNSAFPSGFDVKLCVGQLLKKEVQDLFKWGELTNVWVEYFEDHPQINFNQLVDIVKNCPQLNLFLITGDIRTITKVFTEKSARLHLALKGSESSGFVSSETTLGLLNHIEDLALQSPRHPEIHIWGGVFTPAGAAALLYSGVQSVVFASIHWLTQGITTFSAEQKKRLSSLRLDHSSLIPLSQYLHFRAFNKGNSVIVSKMQKRLAFPLEQEGDITTAITEILETSTAIEESDFGRHDLIPLGPEACYAHTFQSQYSSDTTQSILSFADKLQEHLKSAHGARARLINSSICDDLGTRYPFIQGGMAWISDVPEFALSIAKAGGLPTIALGIQNKNQLEERFSNLEKRLEGHAFAINVITLPENPHREEQLDWIKAIRPPFVVISAGDPAFGATLQKDGIKVIYVTSDPNLLTVAWKGGIDYVVLEGHEAGGHIGGFSTLTLAQAALELRSNNPEYQNKYLIFAGGIFNPNSLTRAAIIGADAVQMGTVYLTTNEITAQGALSTSYQKVVLQSSFGETRITGNSTGLLVRSIDSPKIRAINTLESRMQILGTSEETARRQLEEESVGSLFIAARCRDPLTNIEISQERCLEEGQFMSGTVAGNICKNVPLKELHNALAKKEFQHVLKPKAATTDTARKVTHQTGERIAITAMAMSNSLGNSPEEIWQACIALKSGITEVPSTRWDHSKYYSDSADHRGKTYCRVGAFQSLDISRKDLGISPHDFRTMTPSTKLTLWLADKAIQQSEILSSEIPRHRIGVLVSQNSGESASTIEDLTLSVISPDLAKEIQTQLGLDPSICGEIEKIINKDRISIDDTTLLGRLNCAAGGFICNRYGLTGPSFSVSAACATGLVALYSAAQLIKNDVLDAAIVGGGEEPLHPASFLEFSALGALAGKNHYDDEAVAYSKPFDKHRSGMVLGEGGSLIVIERESLAKERGANILAYITGVGASNNHKGMVESVAETQKIAIRSSFKDASYGADQVDMIECHATATPTGDIEEVTALKAIFPPESNTALSSFKSQIGHTLGSSGTTSLIHGVCALRAKTLPPTLNYNTPDPDIDLEGSGFRVCTTPEPWPHSAQRPRRFQVNAFGFGGANYVVQLEEANWSADEASQQNSELNVSQQTSKETNLGVSFYQTSWAGKDFRLGTVDNSAADVRAQLQPYLPSLDDLKKTQRRTLGQNNIYLREKLAPPPFALVFAGQGSHYHQMGKNLYKTFATIRKWMDKIAELADFDILDLMFNSPEENLRKTQWQQPALFLLEYSIYKQLTEFHLEPAALAGHSMGELTALCVAGSFSYKDAFKIITKRAQCMDKASREAVDPGGMIAVDAPFEILEEMVGLDQNLYFTNFNSPHQIVVGGSTGAIERFSEELGNRNYWNHVLAVSMAFHSPVMKIIRDELGDYLDDIDIKNPQIPVISNTTRRPYPDTAGEMKKIIIAHLESPVHWQSNVTSLSEDYNCSHFVEIGPQDTLSKLIGDIVPQAAVFSTCSKDNEVKTLKQAMATLYTEGILQPTTSPSPLKLDFIDDNRDDTIFDEAKLQQIIQREINSFALQGVEKFLKPAIVKAVSRELGHNCSADELDSYLGVRPATETIPLQTTVLPQQLPPSSKPKKQDVVVEQIIHIIMDATGYERSEIEPEMDIRQDLSIRSSRLPVIMDAAENTFDIVIKLEDFMDVNTIEDFATRVKEVIGRSGRSLPDEASSFKPVKNEKKNTAAANDKKTLPIARMVMGDKKLLPTSNDTLPIDDEDHIVIVTIGGAGQQSEPLRTFLQEEYKAKVSILEVTPLQAESLSQNLSNFDSPTGLVILTNFSKERELEREGIPEFLTDIFAAIKSFLHSSKRKFCVHFSIGNDTSSTEGVVSEGILGILLAANIEYQSVLFRSVRSPHVAVSLSLAKALNRDIKAVHLDLGETGLSAPMLIYRPAVIDPDKRLNLGPEDVVLISGGAQGVGSYISRAIATCGCRVILMGRSTIDAGAEQQKDDIASLLSQIKNAGGKARYFQCDVTQLDQVRALAKEIEEKYGKLSGIMHCAGVLKDSFIPLLSTEHFRQVVNVKFSGLVNLTRCFNLEHTKFIAALSSLAAITGNVGQSNYCCSNRAMASYLTSLDHKNCLVKTFWLPPIEGAGMAEDPDIKEIIKANIGENAFVDVQEISQIILHELLCGLPEKDIIPARTLPEIDSLLVDTALPSTQYYSLQEFDMIDQICSRDYHNDQLIAKKSLDHSRDLWLEDHRPFAFLKHPITSAIMVVESFLEAAAILIPHSSPKYLQNISFLKMLECPTGEKTDTYIHCHHNPASATVSCRLGKAVNTEDVEQPKDIESYFTGEIVFKAPPDNAIDDRELSQSDTQTTQPIVSQSDMAQCYEERCGLTGRYRVLHQVTSCDADSVTGEMIYPEISDFSPVNSNNYHYPLYLLEALMQLVNFQTGLWDRSEKRTMIPTGIKNLVYMRNCNAGEKIYLRAKLINSDKEKLIWQAAAYDNEEKIILITSGMQMTWL